jgi:cytochrome c-type biogenesis protein CcmF
MAALGAFVLLLTFVIASGAFAASLAGARRRSASLVEGGIGLFHTVTALMLVASAILVHAFVVGDYSIRYVQRYSDEAQPLFYKLASYWGGLDGSIMFWVTLLALMGSAAVHINRERHRVLMPWIVATISVVQMFFLFLMVIHNNPFETWLRDVPAQGAGLNPLLQNFYMAIHPPMLYLGFVGMTIPFAFGLAALISGQLDDSWLRAVRRWTMGAWLFLTVGLALGALWAYEELGWGGYWGWDPVENAGLLPWFTATAFLHAVMVQERRSMMKIWNVSLVIVTFFLTIFGTFMTRSGVVQSVHAFGEDPELARMFTVFMIALLTVSFGFVIYRLPLLRSRNELESWASREAAFLANNWILLFSAFFVLFATMFPTLSEAITGERLTVGPPFFNKWMTPVGLILLFLTGFGPLLAWRKSTIANMRQQFLWPVLASIVTGAGVTAIGIPFWASGLCFSLCAFVAVAIGQEFVRGAAVRRHSTGTDFFTALVGLFARSRRRYAGYIIHVGIVLIFLGFAGGGFGRSQLVKVKPGDEVSMSPYVVKYLRLSVTDDERKQAVTAHVEVYRDGVKVQEMYPAQWFFRGRENEPTTEVALRRGIAEDLYVVFKQVEAGPQEIALEVAINPLVNWIWFGVGVLIFGTAIALLPERALAFATSRAPEGAVTTSLLVLVLVLGGAARARAQHVEGPQSSIVVPQSKLEKELHDSIICMCGGCGRKRVGECTCGDAARMRGEIAEVAKKVSTRDEAIAWFVAKYGSQEVLASPIDKGFNRLAWLFPYLAGLLGLIAAGVVALRWSRRGLPAEPIEAVAGGPAHRALNERLDDELRDLD